MYRDNDSGLRPSSYPYILGRALNEYRINTSVIIYLLNNTWKLIDLYQHNRNIEIKKYTYEGL